MKLYQAGDKSRAICEACKGLVQTTFVYRDVPFDDGAGDVKDILVGICDGCGAVLTIPAQSTPAIRRARDVAAIPLEVSLPAPAIDVLDAAAFRIDPTATGRFRKSLLAYYIHKMAGNDGAGNDGAGETLRQLSEGVKARPKAKVPRRRLSCKFAHRTNSDFEVLMQSSGLAKTNVILAVVRQIEKDIVRPAKPKNLKTLQDIAAVVNA